MKLMGGHVRNFGIQNARGSLGGKHSPARYSADTRAGSNIFRLPSKSILHREDVSDSPLNVGAIVFFWLATWACIGLFVGAYYLALFLFGVH